MPSANITYDPLMRKTEAGGRLYSYWRRIKVQVISTDFVAFPGFYIWAIKNGYTLGAKLYKYDPAEPYGPENCFWVPRDEWVGGLDYPPMSQEWRRKWDETINRIRLHFGMKPIGTWEE